MATNADVKTKGWKIAVGDWPGFEIEPAGETTSPHSDENLNGTFPTRLAAIEEVISGLEHTRIRLSEEIARAKRMRRRELAQGMPPEGTRRECGSGASAPASPVRRMRPILGEEQRNDE